MLKIDNLSASYKTIDGNVHVVKDVNFEIYDNEIFGIAGESGCGKSTLLKTLYVNWKGEHARKVKRGFATKREATDWERNFLKDSATMLVEDQADTGI